MDKNKELSREHHEKMKNLKNQENVLEKQISKLEEIKEEQQAMQNSLSNVYENALYHGEVDEFYTKVNMNFEGIKQCDFDIQNRLDNSLEEMRNTWRKVQEQMEEEDTEYRERVRALEQEE